MDDSGMKNELIMDEPEGALVMSWQTLDAPDVVDADDPLGGAPATRVAPDHDVHHQPELDKLPRPVSELNCRMARAYLVKLLRAANNGQNPAYGNPQKKPPFWPDFYWPWEQLTDVHTKPRNMSEPLQYSEMMKLAIARGYQYYGYDPNEYIDRTKDLSEKQTPTVAPPLSPSEIPLPSPPGAILVSKSVTVGSQEKPDGPPPKLPRPASKLNCVQARFILSKLLRHQQKGNNPAYGSPDTKPPWWPEDRVRWCDMVDLRGKPKYLTENKMYIEILKLAVKNAIEYHGYDPETYVDESIKSDLNEKTMPTLKPIPSGMPLITELPRVSKFGYTYNAPDDPSKPPRLPMPVEQMNCGIIRKCLTKLLWFQSNHSAPNYGCMESMPVWWPNHLMDWGKLKNLRHKYEGPLGNSYTSCLRTALILGYSHYGLDPNEYVSSRSNSVDCDPSEDEEQSSSSVTTTTTTMEITVEPPKKKKKPIPPLIPILYQPEELSQALHIDSSTNNVQNSSSKVQSSALLGNLSTMTNATERETASRRENDSIQYSGSMPTTVMIAHSISPAHETVKPRETGKPEIEKSLNFQTSGLYCHEATTTKPDDNDEEGNDKMFSESELDLKKDWTVDFPPKIVCKTLAVDQSIMKSLQRCKVTLMKMKPLPTVPRHSELTLCRKAGRPDLMQVYNIDRQLKGSVDLKLVSGDGKEIWVHKCIIAAQSKMLKEMLMDCDDSLAIITFPDICSEDLEQLTMAMYEGEIMVTQSQFKRFLTALEVFQQYGLLRNLHRATNSTQVCPEMEYTMKDQPGIFQDDLDDTEAHDDFAFQIDKMLAKVMEEENNIISQGQDRVNKIKCDPRERKLPLTLKRNQSHQEYSKPVSNPERELTRRKRKAEHKEEEDTESNKSSSRIPRLTNENKADINTVSEKNSDVKKGTSMAASSRQGIRKLEESSLAEADSQRFQISPRCSRLRKEVNKDFSTRNIKKYDILNHLDILDLEKCFPKAEFWQKLVGRKVLPTVHCKTCKLKCILREDSNFSEKVSWSCPKATSRGKHSKNLDIKIGSLFEGEETDLTTIFEILFRWKRNIGLGECQSETGESLKTICKWYDIFNGESK